jgi:hypothetical protein
MKKKLYNKILLFCVLFSLIFSSIPIIQNVSAIVTSTIDSTSLTGSIAYPETSNLCRGNNQWLHVAYIKDAGIQQIYYARSQDNGSTWTTTAITSLTTSVTPDSVSICINQFDRIFITWETTDTSVTPNRYNLSFVNSTDNGTTWSSIEVFYTSTTYVAQNPSTCIDEYGNLHLVYSANHIGSATWYQIRNSIYWISNTTWNSTISLTSGGTYHRTYPTIQIDDAGNRYVAYCYFPGVATQIYAVTFSNTTKLWSAETQITTDSTATGQLHPFFACNGTNIHLFWYGVPDGGSARQIRHTCYNGITWSAINNISSGSYNAYTCTVTITTNNVLHAIWHESITNRRLRYSTSTDNGITWSATTTLVDGGVENRYPTMLYQTFPITGGIHTNRPEHGFNFVYMSDTDIKYYASTDLEWEGVAPPVYPDYKPSINFASDTTMNQTSTTTNYLNANIKSYTNNTNVTETGHTHYTTLEINNDILTWIQMEEYTGSNVIDSSSYANNGTSKNGASQTSNGAFGYAYYFDGDIDRIDISPSTSMNQIDDTITISIWANSTQDYALFPQNVRALFSFYSSSSNKMFGGIHKGTGAGDGKVAIYNTLGSSYSYKYLSSNLPAGYITTFHHYAFVFTSTNVTCYIDGAYQGSATFDDTWKSLSNLNDGFETTIGRDVYASTSLWTWYGKVDEFIIINRSLTQSEILSLYNATTTQYNHNFTGLQNGNYTFTGYSTNTLGLTNSTETRWYNTSKRYEPTITVISPLNDSSNADLWTSCAIEVNDNNSEETFTVTWMENSTGSWITRHIDTGVNPGDTLSYQYLQFGTIHTTYWWRIFVNDTVYNISDIYHFTTTGRYFILQGLVNNIVDWNGTIGASYWCNATGQDNETLDVNMTLGVDDQINEIGVWIGDLSVAVKQRMTTGWNSITFPEWALTNCLSTAPEDVFDSIHEELVNVTEVTTHKYWNNSGAYNLTEILPDVEYNVFVNSSCELRILSQLVIGASNISMVVSSDNTTWGNNIRSFTDNGTTIRLNVTSWNIINGCYGVNPFPITTSSQHIYLRFKLYLSTSLPSNYTYYSISGSNWKIYIYSNASANDTLPALHLPTTLPTSGNFTQKWSVSDSGVYSGAIPEAKDVNGDGYQEIFMAGRWYNGTITSVGVVKCFNGTTGAEIWNQSFAYPSSSTTTYCPLTIYDYNKDGIQEIVVPAVRRLYCLNALTGAIIWNVSVSCGWHQHSYIDTGTTVYIYTADYDETPPYDGKVWKIYGSNGTVVTTAPMYHSCNGGTSIADINNDGIYEILVTDRKYNYSGGGEPGKGIRCYDEDLNLLWYYQSITCSSHCAMLIDTNNDGDLEVVVGAQGGVNGSRLYVFNPDGTVLKTIGAVTIHNNMACGDIDNDGHIEVLEGDNTPARVIDLTTGTIEYTLPYATSIPPNIGNVILDTGVGDDIYPEIIVYRGSPTYIMKYNLTTHIWETTDTLSINSMWAVVQDFDHDGYNEMFLPTCTPSTRTMKMYETKVPSTVPRARTETTNYGERRLNNGQITYARPYYGSEVYSKLSFGGESYIPGITVATYLPTCTSQHSIIELNGNYNTGNYSTLINITVYVNNTWTIDGLYTRLKYSNGTVYENITSGYTITTLTATTKQYKLNYNPSTSMIGSHLMDVDVYLILSSGGIPVFEGNRTFDNLLTIYNIETPETGISVYNTTLKALNLTWTTNNYTNKYVVLKKSGSTYPTTPTDGTVMQNTTSNAYNESSVYSTNAYTIFGYNTTTNSFTTSLPIPWGAIGVSVYNESNPSQALPFSLEVTNQQGTIVYKQTGLTNTHYIDVNDIPYGTNTIFILESIGYKQRIYYKDITLNTFYNYSFYLPPEETQTGGGGGPGGDTTPTDCTLRLYINSINITNPLADAVITFTQDLEYVVSVEIYNKTLYTSYGGWIMITESNYAVTTTSITISHLILDINTTMARVNYYSMYCPNETINTPIYYIRIVESVETEYTTYDRGVTDAKVDIKRYINTTGVYTSVATLLTDANGYCNVYLIPGTLYKVEVTKTSYDTMIADYIPAPPNQWGQTTEKTFRITLNISNIIVTPEESEYLFKNITWSLEPTGVRFIHPFTMYFNITSSDNKLEWYSMTIKFYNFSNNTWETLFYQIDTNPSGGSISYYIPNVSGKYSVDIWFKKQGYDAYQLLQEGSLMFFFAKLTAWIQEIPDYPYYIAILVIMIMVMGFCYMRLNTGILTGYIGLFIFGIALMMKPITIGDFSGWTILLITAIIHTVILFLWSKI